MTPFETALAKIDLSDTKRIVLTERYVNLMKHLNTRASRVSVLFHISRTIVTVGSLIVPALLSIQYNQTASEIQFTIYWSTWVISLCVTTCNGLMTLFKLDKKYFSLFTVYEHLVSEGWQYIELSGKYSGFYTPTTLPTHDNQFVYFCNSVEKIRMRQIEEEYYKVNETPSTATQPKTTAATAATATAAATAAATPTTLQMIDSLIPPTPFRVDPNIQEFLNYISQKKADEGSSKALESGPPKDTKNTKTTSTATTSATTPTIQAATPTQAARVSTESDENRSSESLPV